MRLACFPRPSANVSRGQNKVRELSRELLAGKWCFRLPVEMICEELEAIADAFLETGGSVREIQSCFSLEILPRWVVFSFVEGVALGQ